MHQWKLMHPYGYDWKRLRRDLGHNVLLHHDVNLFVASQYKNMFIKIGEAVFLVKLNRPRVVFPNAEPSAGGFQDFCYLKSLFIQALSDVFTVKFLQHVNSLYFDGRFVRVLRLGKPGIQF